MVNPEFDADYSQDDLFGEPYEELVDFFSNYPKKGTVLDLGCGQGRDSVALAKMGYSVTAVDSSKVGISKMLDKARKLNLEIRGIVDDIFDFSLAETFDVVLLDSVLQFFKQDREKEGKLLGRIFDYVGVGGLICIFIRKSLPRERYLMNLFRKRKQKWEIVVDRHINFMWTDKSSNQKSKVPFKMVFAKKLSG